MKKIIKLFLIALTLSFICQSVYAAKAKVDIFDLNGISAVWGNVDNKTDFISVSIFNIGKSYQDAENMVSDTLIYANMIMPNKDGSFSLPLNMKGFATGEYGIRVTNGGKTILDSSFVYADKNDFETAIEGLNIAANSGKTAVAQFINTSNNKEKLEFKSDYDGKVSLTEASQMIVSAAPFDKEHKKECVDTYLQAMLAQGIAEKKITDIRTVEEELGVLNISPLNEVYSQKYITDTVKANVLAKAASFAPYTSIDAFNSAICESFVLTVAKNPTGAGDIGTIISAFYPDFPSELLTDSVLRSVANKDYASLDKLKEAMQTKKNEESTPSKGGSGGGSSSSSGGGAPFLAVSQNSGITNSQNTLQPQIQDGTFNDLEGVLWAKEAIEALALEGIIAGKGDGKFCPEDFITREEFVKLAVMLYSLTGNDEESLKFEDVSLADWYYPYVKAAYNNGIVNGISQNLFGVGSKITRQDASVMLYNCMKNLMPTEQNNQAFLDETDISDYAKDAVNYMRSLSIISGYEDNTFKPQNSITRAEAAIMLYNAKERMAK